MKFSKKVLGTAMSLVVLGSQAMPVLADTDPTTGTTGGTANILDYEVETVVVPTALKIALNPNGYTINTKYEKAASYSASAVYYEKKADGSYAKMDPQPTSFVTGTDYYTAVISNEQIVSLNYGIANKSTGDKNVVISFAATYTSDPDTSKKAIQFVDSEEKAKAYNASTNDEGAKSGEHKIYLAVASADDLPTANTHQKVTGTALGSGPYYTKGADGSFSEVASPNVADIKTYYEDTIVIGTEITTAELSDVSMDAAATGVQAFAAGTTDKANASIAYKLDKATYALKDGETIEFGTTQTQLAGKLELSQLGDVAAFTITGAVNPDADWTKADTASITITPSYAITNAAGAETPISGAYKQVSMAPALANTSYSIGADNAAIEITVNNLGDETIDSVVNVDSNSNLTGRDALIDGAKVTIVSSYLAYFGAGTTAQIKITTSGGTELICTVGRP